MARPARLLSIAALAAGILAHYRVRSGSLDPSLFAYAGKSLAQALAPFLAVAAGVSGVIGLRSRDPLAAVSGALAALALARYTHDVTTASDGLAEMSASPAQPPTAPLSQMIGPQRRWRWFLPTPSGARVTYNLVFADTTTAADAHRPLLCDLWQPPHDTPSSGLGIIYLHAGGWQNFDKDRGTRPFLRHLVAQGHVVMDVAYRLCHEADMAGMVGDVKRAIAWLRANSARHGVDARQIVLVGASAGGQLALLAAYTSGEVGLAPPEVRGADTSVCGVISFYGPPDLLRYGAGPLHPDWPTFVRLGRRIGIVTPRAYLAWPDVERRLYGARAQDAPEVAARFSPITYAAAHCPPTLLIHGAHDRVVSVAEARALRDALRAQGATVAYLELPWVDHAFDLILPQVSPAAQTALQSVKQFLALLMSYPVPGDDAPATKLAP